MSRCALRQSLVLGTGPRQASVAGCVRMALETDGETVLRAVPSLGWSHRGVEKLAEQMPFSEVPGLLAHVAHLAVTHVTTAFAMAVENLAAVEVPPRAAWLRAAAMEIERAGSHLTWLGAWTFDAGLPVFGRRAQAEASALADALETLTGSRSAWGFVLTGGVASSPSSAAVRDLVERLGASEKHIDTLADELDRGSFPRVARRLGFVDRETARESGATGPCLRASGVQLDARQYLTFSPYDRVRPAMPTGSAGDCWDRCFVRLEEARWAVRTARDVLTAMPEGAHAVAGALDAAPPAGEAYAAVESPRGELGVHLVCDGSAHPYRLRLRSPSFHNLCLAGAALAGVHLDAVPFVLGSMDLAAGEIER